MSSAVALYARPTAGHDARVAHALALLRDASQLHAGAIVFATSLGAEDMVITDLISRHALLVPLATLDTGKLHGQTLELMGRIESRYGLKIERWRPPSEQVVQFVRRHGEMAMRESIELRKACCAIRKLEPLTRALQGRRAWITGLRREQSDARAEVPFSSVDDNGRTKLSPLADWSWHDVWQYITTHEVLTHPLHDAFYPSIGCEPCTRAVSLGEDFRAGRWWWESESARECGLHVTRSESQEVTV